MDGRGGCCIARYAGGGAYDASKINRIMLKFRPIAPKPAPAGGLSGSSASENSDKHVKTVRGKRKYVKRCNKNNNDSCKKKRKASTSSSETDKTTSGGSVTGGEELVTLSLLPETPERKDSPARNSPDLLSVGGGQVRNGCKNNSKSPIWLSFENQTATTESHVMKGFCHVRDQPKQQVKVVGSFVVVESVTDTWIDGNGIGCTDEERMLKLDDDTCPGFISDGKNRVWWTNKAYKEMAGQVAGEEELMVWVVMKEWVTMPVTYPAFTCKVRVTCGKERTKSPPLTVPCDVWRMKNGGYAWRLDVKAALSLGR